MTTESRHEESLIIKKEVIMVNSTAKKTAHEESTQRTRNWLVSFRIVISAILAGSSRGSGRADQPASAL
ncbi:MAG: hypothetical protein AB7O84_09480 [Planctomycetota bacterium]